MAKRKSKAKMKTAPKKVAIPKPELTVNPIEFTNWLDKFVARCKVLWDKLIAWLKTSSQPPAN